jgi:uncharacterized membrane protein HdeD (DUF308 family)
MEVAMPRTFWLDPFDALESASRHWVFVISGMGWLFVSLIVFGFDWATVTPIGVLFGCIALVAGLLEFVAASVSSGGWKILRYFLGVLFVVVGVYRSSHRLIRLSRLRRSSASSSCLPVPSTSST